MSAHKLTNVEMFEADLKIAKQHLESMATNPIVVMGGYYPEFMRRVRYIEELAIEISDVSRSDKD